jgi:phosphoglycolate phosphatase
VNDPAYDLVIFDLDGTLIDSVGDIADALATTLGRELRDEDVARWVGSGVHELLRRAGAAGDLDDLARRYRAQYAKVPVRHTRPYLRVKESLRALTVDKAVATNKPGALARTIVDKLGLAPELALVLGEDDVGQKKPDPLIVDVILVDAATADAAGVDLCLVTYGYEDQARIAAAPAKFHIDRFEDVVGIVSGNDPNDAK